MRANEFVKKFGWDVAATLSKEMRVITESVADAVAVWGQSEWDKLKRLVESYEFVSANGGVDGAMKYINSHDPNATSKHYNALRAKVADVESCQ